MRRLPLALLLAFVPVASAAPASANLVNTTDTRAVLGLLRGKVEMYGTTFGNVEFQRGILQLAQNRSIQVRVLTAQGVVQNMRPLKAAGAAVYALKANFTSSMIVVEGGPVIFPNRNGFQIMQDPKQVAAVMGLLSQYWGVAKRY
ncbi:hypothetical protein [Deinococcus hopiensis]|uniref:DUF302 domain-containing protein n=1 Tax=Deinococcus hopiensis KR-140 TaxID=695939 RepID=A0A1W1UAS5_9DEIO|nr:hypothetical protein [Deinococcus hopiensis]SMB77874.1 hypothetical protein SAMN00790413_03978 [Deinococcus hopiensis KR-140]